MTTSTCDSHLCHLPAITGGSLQVALQVCPLSSASPHALISCSERHTKAQASQRRAHTATLPCVPLSQLPVFCARTLTFMVDTGCVSDCQNPQRQRSPQEVTAKLKQLWLLLGFLQVPGVVSFLKNMIPPGSVTAPFVTGC